MKSAFKNLTVHRWRPAEYLENDGVQFLADFIQIS